MGNADSLRGNVIKFGVIKNPLNSASPFAAGAVYMRFQTNLTPDKFNSNC